MELERYGYTNFSQVLNAKNYGVPQNRERIFMVSILNCEQAYYFPTPLELTNRLKDVLEENVDEKYYLSDKMLEGFMMHNEKHQAKGTGFLFEPTEGEGTAKCLRANAALSPTDNAIIDTTKPIGGQFLEFKNFISRGEQNNSYNRVWKTDGYCGALNCTKEMEVLVPTASKGKKAKIEVVGDLDPNNKRNGGTTRQQNYVIGANGLSMAITAKHIQHEFKVQQVDYRIRRLTERECFRLMGVCEEYIDLIQAAGISRSQQYKMAGNSIVVDVLVAIFRQLLIGNKNAFQQLEIF